MKMIEITEHKIDKLSEHIEQGLRHIGKAMQCVDEWMEEGDMKEPVGYGMRGGYGMRYNQGGRYGGGHMNQRYPIYGGYGMGYKDDEDWDDEEIAERRGRRRDSRGRYM